MKICPFMSHMLGADGNVLEIGASQANSSDVEVLGYGDDGAVGVKTERKQGRAATTRDSKETASHLYCLKDTCRFYRAKDGECTFDSIMSNVVQQGRTLSDLRRKADSNRGDDKTSATVTRELEKFWSFQTQSVAEMISSLGEQEKRQNDAFKTFVGDIEKRVIAFMDDEDNRDDRMNVMRDGIVDIKDTIDARNDGFETLTTTVSDLVLSFEDNLKEMKSQWDQLAARIDSLESINTRMESLDNVTGRLDAMDDMTSRLDNVSDQLTAIKDVATRIDGIESNVNRTLENLERMEKNWEELMEALRDSKKNAEVSANQKLRREAMKFNNLGVTSFHNGDLELARDHFLEAIKRDGSFAECFNNLGLVYTELNESDSAADAFSQAIKLNPELHAAYNNLGYVFYRQGNYERAIDMYNEALGRSTNNSSAYTNLGNAHFKLGNHDEARNAWQQAIELDPSNDNARRSLKNLG
jgi:tetratricopeptide (TPR) repeat protein